MEYIVHICAREAWKVAQGLGEYRAASLESEGFIHFSQPEQAVNTANRYYAGRHDLMLLWINPQALTAELRWEASHGEPYPHLYGPLNLGAVTQVTAFPPDAEGVFRSLPSNEKI